MRAAPPGWRDARLWVGVAIVAVSVIGGARLLGAADDSVPVWAVASDMGPGDTVTADDLVSREVRFVDPAELDTYFPADERAAGRPLAPARASARGSCCRAPPSAPRPTPRPCTSRWPWTPRSSRRRSGPARSSTSTSPAPPTRRRPATGSRGRAVLSEVVVIEAPPLDEGFAVTGRRQLVLGVAEDDAARFFRQVGGLDAPALTVVRRG